MAPRLTVELVPATSWYDNVRSAVPKRVWDRIRKEVYARAGHRCEVCGGVGAKHPVECHEIWHYDDQKHVQTLVGFQALCPACHEVKHLGLAFKRGRFHQPLNHLVRVNGWTSADQVDEYVLAVFAQHKERSQYEWRVDLSYLDQFLGKETT